MITFIGTGSGGAKDSALRYGVARRGINRSLLRLGGAILAAFVAVSARGQAAPVKIMAFGDSLFAGYGVPDADNFPSQLDRALKADGKNVVVINAAVSGDTTADGLARLDWSLADKPDLVLLELGANDALRGLDPALAEANLDQMLSRLAAAHVPVLLVGMLAPRNLGPSYAAKFDPMYKQLAEKYHAPLYPFVLDGVAMDPALNQVDGMHPNPKGVAVIVRKMLPVIEKALPAAPGPVSAE